MAGWRQAVALAMTEQEIEALTALSRSRDRTGRPGVAGQRCCSAIGRSHRSLPWDEDSGVHHQTVQRCVELLAMAYGALAALDDRPRLGKELTITPEAGKAWLVSLACDKAKEHGYPHELWTTRYFWPSPCARARTGGVVTNVSPVWLKAPCASFSVKRKSSRTRCATIWNAATPSSRAQRWRKFCVSTARSSGPGKSRCQGGEIEQAGRASSLTTRSLESRPSPRRHRICCPCQAAMRASRGIMSTNAMARSGLLAGIDLLTGKVHALVRERYRLQPREFIEFLKLLDAAYPASTAIKLILDNHSAHISRWKPEPGSRTLRPPGRFDFTFTPKHGSWLNLIEGFF